jgi:hypothetical protein
MVERRRVKRTRILAPAAIIQDGSLGGWGCFVRDITALGARLEIPNAPISRLCAIAPLIELLACVTTTASLPDMASQTGHSVCADVAFKSARRFLALFASWRGAVPLRPGTSVAVMQQFGRYRMNSGQRADTIDRSKMTPSKTFGPY